MKLCFTTALLIIISQTLMGQAKIASKDALNDIDQLISTFERVHYNPYFKSSKEEVYQLKKDLTQSWISDSITYRRFMVAGMKLTAEMSGGHSNMLWKNPNMTAEIKRHAYLPFTGKLVDQRFVITKSGQADLAPESIVLSINGMDIVDLYRECMTYTGGIEAFKMDNVERIFPVYLMFYEELKAPYTIELLNPSKTLTTEGIDVYALAKVLQSDQAQADYTFEILENHIGLISYNYCNDYKKFRKFLAKTFETIQKEGIDKLIIDIRQNGGGDSSLNDLLLSYITTSAYSQSSGRYWKVSEEAKKAYSGNKVYTEMFGEDFMAAYMGTANQEIIADLDSTALTEPEKPENFFEGKTCMLIGPGTFSSANFLADAVKTYGLTTLIGTPTGEYTNDFGEQLSFTLKNSGSTVFISSTYDIGANGDASTLAPVYPDILVEDDALGFAVEWIGKSKDN